jgi:hypothetical protein
MNIQQGIPNNEGIKNEQALLNLQGLVKLLAISSKDYLRV